MKKTLEETQIGTFGKIHTIQPSTPVIAALCLFVENRVSALPIVNENGEVIDIYAKFDAIVSYEMSLTSIDFFALELSCNAIVSQPRCHSSRRA